MAFLAFRERYNISKRAGFVRAAGSRALIIPSVLNGAAGLCIMRLSRFKGFTSQTGNLSGARG